MKDHLIVTIELTEPQARVLRKMVIHHLEMIQGDGSLSDEDDDTLVEVNAIIREKTAGVA